MDPVKPILGRRYVSARDFEQLGRVLDPCDLWDGTLLLHDPGASYGSIVGPEARTASILCPMESPVEVGPDGVLSAEHAIEGFSLPMKHVFKGLDRRARAPVRRGRAR